jgi:hypothetical protein
MGPMELYEALPEIDKKVVDMGWTALNVPAKYGGQQIDAVSLGVIFEESAKVDPYVETVGAMQATSALLETLPEDVQDEWFPPLIRRERRHAFGFTEAAAGSDAASIATKAVRDGDDYIISGEKFPIPFAMVADAASISVKTDPSAGFKGISMFWVPLNLPGITKSHLPWMGNPNLVSLSRRGNSLVQRARRLRPAHFQIPGGVFPHRRALHQGRSGKAAVLPGLVAQRPGDSIHHGMLHGQVVQRRGVDPGHQGLYGDRRASGL